MGGVRGAVSGGAGGDHTCKFVLAQSDIGIVLVPDIAIDDIERTRFELFQRDTSEISVLFMNTGC